MAMDARAEYVSKKRALVGLQEHFRSEHGVRPEAREKTDPATMESDRVRLAWARRYLPEAQYLPFLDFYGMNNNAFTDEARERLNGLIAARQENCADSTCPGLAGLQAAWAPLHDEVLTLGSQVQLALAEEAGAAVAEAVEITTGDVQAITPEGLEEGTDLQGQ